MTVPSSSSIFGTTLSEAETQASDDLVRLEDAVSAALNAAGLYDIGSYGWLNEHDEDPDLAGHAMWQLDQPLVRTLLDPFGESRVRERPSGRDKQVLIAGEDFCGTMRLARCSIGLALHWRARRPGSALDESAYFWVHHTDALLKLAIASDRLRDVLVVACTGDSMDAYEKTAKRRKWYVTPFQEVRQLLEARRIGTANLEEAIVMLSALTEQLYKHIERRNVLVHEIATRLGQTTRKQLEALQARCEREQCVGVREPSPMPAVRDFREVMVEYHAELDAAVRMMSEWYTLLVKASNYVFQVEYWSRVALPAAKPQ